MTKTKKWSEPKGKNNPNKNTLWINTVGFPHPRYISQHHIDREVKEHIKYSRPTDKEIKWLKSKRGNNAIINEGRKIGGTVSGALSSALVLHAREYV